MQYEVGTVIDGSTLVEKVETVDIWEGPTHRYSIVDQETGEMLKKNIKTLILAREYANMLSGKS